MYEIQQLLTSVQWFSEERWLVWLPLSKSITKQKWSFRYRESSHHLLQESHYPAFYATTPMIFYLRDFLYFLCFTPSNLKRLPSATPVRTGRVQIPTIISYVLTFTLNTYVAKIILLNKLPQLSWYPSSSPLSFVLIRCMINCRSIWVLLIYLLHWKLKWPLLLDEHKLWISLLFASGPHFSLVTLSILVENVTILLCE